MAKGLVERIASAGGARKEVNRKRADAWGKKGPFKRGRSGATSRGKRHHFPRRPPGSPGRRSRDLENLRENGAACITSSRCYIPDMYTPSPASRGDGSACARARITLYYVYDKRELRLVTFRGVRYSR